MEVDPKGGKKLIFCEVGGVSVMNEWKKICFVECKRGGGNKGGEGKKRKTYSQKTPRHRREPHLIAILNDRSSSTVQV